MKNCYSAPFWKSLNLHQFFPFWSRVVLLCLLLIGVGTRPAYGDEYDLVLNEVMALNGTAVFDWDEKNYSDWIEIYNKGGSWVDLRGLYLSDDPANPTKWRISSSIGVSGGKHAIFWADGKNYYNHTNFQLSGDGEILLLSDANGNLIDAIDYTTAPQIPDVSYGRETDGSANWLYFSEATPKDDNAGAAGIADASQMVPTPTFSQAGGFYNNQINVSLSTASIPGVEIYYTTNGSLPTQNATHYTGAFNVGDTTVVRARAFAPGYLPSEMVFHTFFIDDESTLPVVSIATDPDNMFDADIGIYVEGSDFDGNPYSSNYHKDWERPIAIEMYEPDGSLSFSEGAGVEIHGGYSRRFPIKSLYIKSGAQYGNNDFDYRFFEDKTLDEFEGFVLRSSGNDHNRSLFRDGFMQSALIGMMDLDYQSYRPAVVFINGEYWGIHNIREKVNADYLEANHEIDKDNIDRLSNNVHEEPDVRDGDATHYEALIDYMKTHSLSNSSNYAYVQTQMDVDEFMNYQIAEIYYGAKDWPGNNIEYWRTRTADGRWRWIIFDTDVAFGYGHPFNHDTLAYATDPNGPNYPNPPWSTFLLRTLLTNDAFKEEFAQRFISHINITFEEDRLVQMINTFEDNIEDEVPRHVARWAHMTSVSSWRNRVEDLRYFAERRADYVIDDINGDLNLSGTQALTLARVGEGNVTIQGVPVQAFPFEGPYFKNIPIRLQARTAEGYQFVRWQETGETTPQITFSISTDTTRTAVFEPYVAPQLVINEIHYNPAPDPLQGEDPEFEFIEIYNNDSVSIDLTGMRITEAIDFTFPNASINPGEYIIVASNATHYTGHGYQVFEWGGELNGQLKNGGETVRLENGDGNLIDAVIYNDDTQAGWTDAPDGNGPSLELIDPSLENGGEAAAPAAPQNWEPSADVGGTPGRTNADPPGIFIKETGERTYVSENGGVDTYTIVLNSRPTHNVIVTLATNNQLDLGNGPGASIALTFTPNNALTPQTVTFSAVDDAAVEGTHTSLIAHTLNSSDAAYNGLAAPSVTVTINDNDGAVVITESAGATLVSEAGQSDTYTIALKSRPMSNVQVTVTPDMQLSLGGGAGVPVILTFTPNNALTPQTLTVSAVADANQEGVHTGHITHTTNSNDLSYHNVAVNDVFVTITEETLPGNGHIHRIYLPLASDH